MLVASSPASARPWWVLLFLAAVVGFFVSLALQRSRDMIWGDGPFYYAYDQSLVLDGDLDFTNQYAVLHIDETRRTPTGLVRNKYPIGAPLLNLPFFLAGHGVAVAARHLGLEVRDDGFSVPEQIGFSLGTMFWGFLGMVLAVRLVGRVVGQPEAAIAASVWLVGSSLPYYLFKNVGYAHGCSFFAVTAFLAYDRETESLTVRTALVLGLLAGLMTLVENQNVLLGVVPLVRRWRQLASAPLRHLALAPVLAAGIAIGFAPQLVAWTILFGKPLVYSYGSERFEWLQHLGAVLFSLRRGLVVWTPIAGLALAGLVLGALRVAELRAYLAGFAGQWLVNGSWHVWSFGWSFGSRKFMSISAIFMIGLAQLVRLVPARRRPLLWWVLGVLMVGNVVFAFLYMMRWVSQN